MTATADRTFIPDPDPRYPRPDERYALRYGHSTPVGDYPTVLAAVAAADPVDVTVAVVARRGWIRGRIEFDPNPPRKETNA